jgi:DnaJ-class molecular chaperone
MSEDPTTDMRPGDEAPEGTPTTGEAICPECSGSGSVEGASCETCSGTGKVIEGVGGG